MALNIKNAEVERLAAEVAEMARETKTEAIRRALEDRKAKLQTRPRKRPDLVKYLERHVWPFIPAELRGRPPMSKEEREEILGIGPDGV